MNNFSPCQKVPTIKCDGCSKSCITSGPVYYKQNSSSYVGCKCVSRSVSLEDNLHRTFSYDEVAKLKALPCKFEYNGCPETLPYSHGATHENICEFRDICCPFTDWVGPQIEILKHCKTDHQDIIIKANMEQVITPNQVLLYLIAAFDTIFILRIKVSKENGKIFHCISCVDAQENPTHYSYKLNILSRNTHINPVTYANNFTMNCTKMHKLLNNFNMHLQLCNFENNEIIAINLVYQDNEESVDKNIVSCINTKNGCNFVDNKIKVNKHVDHFCQHETWCEICGEYISRNEHYEIVHNNITHKNGFTWTTILSDETQWRIISTLAGFLLCSYEIKNGLDIKIRAPINSSVLETYICEVEFPEYGIRKVFDVHYNNYIDYQLLIDLDVIKPLLTKSVVMKIQLLDKSDVMVKHDGKLSTIDEVVE